TKKAATKKAATKKAATKKATADHTPGPTSSSGIAIDPAILRERARDEARSAKATAYQVAKAWTESGGTTPLTKLSKELRYYSDLLEGRRAVLGCTPAQRAAAAKAARAGSRERSLDARAKLAIVFDDPAWIAEVAAEALAAGPPKRDDKDWDSLLWAVVRDVDTAVALVAWGSRSLPYFGPYIASDVLFVHDAKGAATVLSAMLDRAREERWKPVSTKPVAKALACIDDPRAATWLAAQAHAKGYEKMAAAYFEARPHRLAILEARVAGAKGKAATDLARLLDSVRRATGATKEPKRAKPASASTLPPILREPPWLDAPVARPRAPIAWREDHFDFLDLTGFPVYSRNKWASSENDAAQLAHIEGDAWRMAGALSMSLASLTDAAAIGLLERRADDIKVKSARDLQGFAGRLRTPGAKGLVRVAAGDPKTHTELLLRSRSMLTARTLANLVAADPFEAARVEAWMVECLDVALDALLPMAVGDDDDEAWAASLVLWTLDARGLRPAIEARAAEDGKPARAAIAAVLDREPRLRVPPRAPKLPKKLDLGTLPPLELEAGGAIGADAVPRVVEMLAFSPTDASYAGLTELREACTQASLDAFASALADDWIVRGAPRKEAFSIYALGHLGSDAVVKKLDEDSRGWAGSRSVELMQRALDVLALVDTDAALSALSERGLRSEFEDTRARVKALLDRAAARRGVSVDALEDRLVPDLDTSPLDFGRRAFRIELDASFAPMLVDEGGGQVAKLPKPGKQDDAALAKASIARWKSVEQTLAAYVQHQAVRFERALRTERAFAPADLRALSELGVVGTIVRRLAFEDAKGRLFRIDEAGAFADARDEAFTPSGPARLAHPLRSAPKELEAMARVFADYEIIEPFPQLGRETFRPSAKQLRGSTLDDHAGAVFSHDAVMTLLRGRGWNRTPLEDTMAKLVYPLEGSGRAAVRLTPGLYFGEVKARPDQTLGPLVLEPAARGGKPPTFGDLPPLLVSELIRDAAVAAK
ncbi:MAG: DUF4132 domain-containing protein, partial [Myxococcales bacterium]|nr:DUF4132 domain-containing protein [Myxococcales bacterium]